jgi:hypothetical protein
LAWVVGIGIGLALLFSYPKQMLSLMGILAVLGGTTLLFVVNADSKRAQEAQARRASIYISVKYDQTICSPSFPLVVTIENTFNKTLLSVNFDLIGKRSGYSDPVLKTPYSVKSDKIISSGGIHTACWSVPEASYGTSNSVPPNALEWTAEYAYADFEGE